MIHTAINIIVIKVCDWTSNSHNVFHLFDHKSKNGADLRVGVDKVGGAVNGVYHLGDRGLRKSANIRKEYIYAFLDL